MNTFTDLTQITDPIDFLPTKVPKLMELDSLLRCHICKEFMTAPMLALCGHSYCSLCIRTYLIHTPQCPICSKELRESNLSRNILVEEIIICFKGLRFELLHQLSTVEDKKIETIVKDEFMRHKNESLPKKENGLKVDDIKNEVETDVKDERPELSKGSIDVIDIEEEDYPSDHEPGEQVPEMIIVDIDEEYQTDHIPSRPVSNDIGVEDLEDDDLVILEEKNPRKRFFDPTATGLDAFIKKPRTDKEIGEDLGECPICMKRFSLRILQSSHIDDCLLNQTLQLETEADPSPYSHTSKAVGRGESKVTPKHVHETLQTTESKPKRIPIAGDVNIIKVPQKKLGSQVKDGSPPSTGAASVNYQQGQVPPRATPQPLANATQQQQSTSPSSARQKSATTSSTPSPLPLNQSNEQSTSLSSGYASLPTSDHSYSASYNHSSVPKLSTPQYLRMTKLDYSSLSTASLKSKLAKLELPTTGTRPQLEARYNQYLIVWNANCDSIQPRDPRLLRRQLAQWESTIIKSKAKTDKTSLADPDWSDLIKKARESVKNSNSKKLGDNFEKQEGENLIKTESNQVKKVIEEENDDLKVKEETEQAPESGFSDREEQIETRHNKRQVEQEIVKDELVKLKPEETCTRAGENPIHDFYDTTMIEDD